MNTFVDKKQEDKNQSVSSADSQVQGGGESTFQIVDNRPEAVAQRKMQGMANNGLQAKQTVQLKAMVDKTVESQQTVQKKENKTGLPDNLKTGIENLSGLSLDDVKVHRNSDKPAQLQAHAYAQGTEIHLGPGQEKHLPHEAWHVVQQKQGRVQPTFQMRGDVNVNDSTSLEKEADVMGAKSMSASLTPSIQRKSTIQLHDHDFHAVASQLSEAQIVQRVNDDEGGAGGFLIKDGQGKDGGLMDKVDFLNQLQNKITAMADEVLAAIGQTSAGCPYIETWISYYKGLDAALVERAIYMYVPGTSGNLAAAKIITLVVARVREGLQAQVKVGLDEVNESAPMELTSNGAAVNSLQPPEVAQLKSEVVQLGSKKKKKGGYKKVGLEDEEAVDDFRMIGRQAEDDASKTAASRTDDASSAFKGMTKSAAFITADVFAPGAGTGASALNAAKGVKDKHRLGKGKKEFAKAAVVESSASVVPYIAFARDLGNLCKAAFQSDKGRTAKKLERVENQLGIIEDQLVEANDLLTNLQEYGDDVKVINRLEKAIHRMEKAHEIMTNWLKKKSGKGKLPLLSVAATDSSAGYEEDDPFDELDALGDLE